MPDTPDILDISGISVSQYIRHARHPRHSRYFRHISKSDISDTLDDCHARDNQSHPRPKISPSRLVPLPSRLLQIAEITCTSPLRTPYVI